MKLEFIYGPFSTGSKIFDFEHLFEDPQGLTGSEVSCFCMARAMAKRGHEVSLYTGIPARLSQDFTWEGVTIKHLNRFVEPRQIPQVVYSWNEPNLLSHASPQSLRMVNQQLNDWLYCNRAPFDQWVDIYTSPSQTHQNYLHTIGETTPHKWQVLPNGYDPSLFDLTVKRNPGTVMYASSPDRGLHLLLECWPDIRAAVPNATLKIFYSFDYWMSTVNMMHKDYYVDAKETVARAQYISYAFDRMKNGYGIEHHKSVGKNRLAKEMCQSMVLGYFCDTVRFTEGYSVTTLEACASGMLPVISSVDSLGEIYGKAVPTVEVPVRKNLNKCIELVIKGLTDEKWRSEQTTKSIEFAKDFTWDKNAEKLEQIMLKGLMTK